MKRLLLAIIALAVFLAPPRSFASESPGNGSTYYAPAYTGSALTNAPAASPTGASPDGGISTTAPKPFLENQLLETIPAEELITEETLKDEDEAEDEDKDGKTFEEDTNPYFGKEFFIPARKNIQDMEKRIISGDQRLPTMEQRDALAGFVGPLEMVTSSVYASVPGRYFLSPGDEIKVSYWSKMLELRQIKLVVDESGYVDIPQAGKIVVRGMTLDQLQKTIESTLRRIIHKDIQVVVSLGKLKSIQIFITGEAFRPGSYAVSAVTTLFNALYAAGGPTNKGSLRDIRLLRDQKTIRVDFYDYLLRGDSYNDTPLRAGDTVFIPIAKRMVSIEGEVHRPGSYELKDGESLRTLIDLAGGMKPSGMLEKVLIESINPNRERIVIDVDLTKGGYLSDPPLSDGDSVVVQSVLPGIANMVTLAGSVERPGVYEFKRGMRISDLFSDINNPLPDVHLERADLIRQNDDRKTTTLIPINLGKALEGDLYHNIKLEWMDRLIVYSKWDVQYIPPRVVHIFGAVQRPGRYLRSDGMNLQDIILAAGGPTPGFYEWMELARAKRTGEIEIKKIDINKLLDGDETLNITLEDEDVVMVKKKTEFFDVPFYVRISGEVKYPGTYALKTRTDRLSDIIERAGGYTELAYPKGTVFERKREYMESIGQLGDLRIVDEIINITNRLEYERQVARNTYLLMKEQEEVEAPLGATKSIVTSGRAAEAAAVGIAPGVAAATGKAMSGAIDTMGQLPSTVSEARQFGMPELRPSERIIIDMLAAISSPGGDADLVLKEGDRMEVIREPNTVSVVGGVMRPTVVTFRSGKDDSYYVSRSGGFTEDANLEKIVVLRVDGSIIPLADAGKMEEGDVIYVPAKVMATEIVERIDKVIEVVKFTLTTVASVVVFIALIGMF